MKILSLEIDGDTIKGEPYYHSQKYEKECDRCGCRKIKVVVIGSDSTPSRRVKLVCPECKKIHRQMGENGYSMSVEEITDKLIDSYVFDIYIEL